MRSWVQAVFCLVVLTYASQGDDLRITDLFCTWTDCDYLIITPERFLPYATSLARHRNSFSADDVEYARVLCLEDIYAAYPVLQSLYHQSIWQALKHVYQTWYSPMRYVLLMGDDRLEWDYLKNSPVSTGVMPSFLKGYSVVFHGGKLDTVYEFSDDYYLDLQREAVQEVPRPGYNLPLAIGRIPCETEEQCSLYVSKVIRFDHEPLASRSWRNRFLFLADDAKQDTAPDPLLYRHFESSEMITAMPVFRGAYMEKVYLSAYTRLPHARSETALQAIINSNQRGALWMTYFGHGSPWRMSDETLLRGSDALFMRIDRPAIVLSLSCLNGSYHLETEKSMCKLYLFAPAGAIAYLASTTLEYSYQSERFSSALFSSLPEGKSLGMNFIGAKRECRAYNLHRYHLLGDPALRPSKKFGDITLHAEIQNHGLYVTINTRESVDGYYEMTIALLDTVRLLDDTTKTFIVDTVLFQKSGHFDRQAIERIYTSSAGVVKVTGLVWNGSMEAKVDTILELQHTAVLVEAEKKRTPYTVSQAHNFLRIEIPPYLLNKTDIVLCDLQGRRISSLPLHQKGATLQIDINDLNIASGNYILTVGSKDGSVRVRRMLSKK